MSKSLISSHYDLMMETGQPMRNIKMAQIQSKLDAPIEQCPELMMLICKLKEIGHTSSNISPNLFVKFNLSKFFGPREADC